MTFAQKLLGFRGRLRRSDWWMCGIALRLGQFVASELLIVLLLGQHRSLFAGGLALRSRDAPALAISVLTALAALWPALALAYKRARDVEMDAGLLAAVWAAVAVATLGGPSLLLGLPPEARGPAVALLVAAAAWLVLSLGLRDGAKGPNRFGPSPKARRTPVF